MTNNAEGTTLDISNDNNNNNTNLFSLNRFQASALLTADCVGVGILALPVDVQELGWLLGLGFLIANLPINYYAGTILASAATRAEQYHHHHSDHGVSVGGHAKQNERTTNHNNHNHSEFEMVATEDIRATHNITIEEEEEESDNLHRKIPSHHSQTILLSQDMDSDHHESDAIFRQQHQHYYQQTVNTQDFIGLAAALFHDNTYIRRCVVIIYVTNIFLVLGDYILVMSHAVQAMLGDDTTVCLPTAGIIASILMFALSQVRTMATLGREATVVSLIALFLVLGQCLIGTQQQQQQQSALETDDRTTTQSPTSIWRKFSALASIGFAVGSQKLFLNIRHEMDHKRHAPQTLAMSLTSYGIIYILVIFGAGSDPPPLLFDAIPLGRPRQLAGLFLWIHVAVSYAINSQALCASIDRRLVSWTATVSPRQRWIGLTLAMAVSSYTVANAVPFFQDLVSLIGALTSVPLSLILPAILYRKSEGLTLCMQPSSLVLLAYSILFLGVGLVGSVYSIDRDWANARGPFACH